MKHWERSAAARAMTIDYQTSTMIPIRDMQRDGRIVFRIVIYGLTGRDLCRIPGGTEPIERAVRRLGLDPVRYQAWFMDVDVSSRRVSPHLPARPLITSQHSAPQHNATNSP